MIAMTSETSTATRVMVVDDNREAATSLGLLLGAAGFRVRTCFGGAEALAAAEEFRPDACVLDIEMPGLDGYEVARRLRGRAGGPPVLATVTGRGDDAHLDRAVHAGFDLHFTKPADPWDVAEQLGECIRR